jgi:hypothetical protein
MASHKKSGGKSGGKNGELRGRMERLEDAFVSLEQVQRDTIARLGRIEETMRLSSRLIELMNERLGKLEEGQQRALAAQDRIVAGQERVVERLDRLIEAATRERTAEFERIVKLEHRVEQLERRS